MSPTNKAARIIKGQTVHKFSKVCNVKYLKEHNISYIFIDEISMLSECFYKYFITLKRAIPDLKFIIAGDFNQLMPVNDRVVDCDYKQSPALHELVDGNRLQLSKCRRSDDKLFNLVRFENIKQLNKEQFNREITNTHLAFTNIKRIEINSNMMNKVAKTKHKKPLVFKKLDHDDSSQDVKLFAGTPIIAKRNNKAFDICNNETFIILEIQNKKQQILIGDEDRKIEIPFDKFQILFNVAYCITIHKSQGATFNHPYTIHEWSRLDQRLKYVALSRSTNYDFINIA